MARALYLKHIIRRAVVVHGESKLLKVIADSLVATRRQRFGGQLRPLDQGLESSRNTCNHASSISAHRQHLFGFQPHMSQTLQLCLLRRRGHPLGDADILGKPISRIRLFVHLVFRRGCSTCGFALATVIGCKHYHDRDGVYDSGDRRW